MKTGHIVDIEEYPKRADRLEREASETLSRLLVFPEEKQKAQDQLSMAQDLRAKYASYRRCAGGGTDGRRNQDTSDRLG